MVQHDRRLPLRAGGLQLGRVVNASIPCSLVTVSLGSRSVGWFHARNSGRARGGLRHGSGRGGVVPATAREGRRRGVATTLVREAEKRVREWGCTEMDLVVDESNKPARNLYSKLGYSVINKEQSDTLVPTDDGRIAKQTTTTLTMRRDLNGGFDILPVAGAVVVALGAVYVNLF